MKCFLKSIIKFLSIGIDRSEQTVHTQTRQVQSDQGLCCLPQFHLHFLDTLSIAKNNLFHVKDNYVRVPDKKG